MLQRTDPGPRAIGVGVSRSGDPLTAVREAAADLDTDRCCFVMAVVPDRLNRDALTAAFDECLAGVQVIGCTTAGQITPQGYEDDALLLLAFPRAHFRCATQLIAPLNPLSIEKVSADARRLSAQFPQSAHWHRLALIFADGLSMREDLLVAALAGGWTGCRSLAGQPATRCNFEVRPSCTTGGFTVTLRC
ncbi:GfdT [Rhodovulum sp. P5]|uniref:FIST N-terminal domain-containing protein n=1 Tax=Rhodovulum sp. P5 TaxID=1564506 RepID=UPI0009C3482B|nr:GfdT [Rhodovulum sp. P5]